MNAVDAVYEATNWNANGRSSVGYAGSLRVRFNEIHVIYSFTGSYASMAPTKRFSNCPLDDDGMELSVYILMCTMAVILCVYICWMMAVDVQSTMTAMRVPSWATTGWA